MYMQGAIYELTEMLLDDVFIEGDWPFYGRGISLQTLAAVFSLTI